MRNIECLDTTLIVFSKMKLLGLLAAVVCLLLAAPSSYAAIAAGSHSEDEDTLVEFHAPAGHPGYPDAFHLSYMLFKSTLSPNKQYGVIFPSWLLRDSLDATAEVPHEPGPDFIVDAKNSRILGLLETDEPYFQGKNHGSLSVNWSPDSAAALIENGGKWFPLGLVLIELKDGKVFRQTQLLNQLEKMFSPAIAKAEHARASDVEVDEFVFRDLTWKKVKGPQLEITCEGGTNPKGFPEKSEWRGKLVAVWDLAQQKFSEHRVTQTSFRRAGKEE